MKKRFTLLLLSGFMCGSFAYGDCVYTGANLLTNGDFNLGNTNFTSTLGYAQNCLAGYYWVGTSMNTKCSIWPATFVDHTTGTGNFLVVDGNDSNAPQDVWMTSVSVVVNQTYVFSFWAKNLYTQNPFPLGFMINGVQVATSANIAAGTWNQYSIPWTSTITGTIPISIRQLTAGLYRDFGVDDIAFGKCEEDVAVIDPGNNSTPFSLFPNPASSRITIFNSEKTPQPYYIYDVAGQLVQSGKMSAGEITLDVAELPEGMYFIQVGKIENMQTLKFVKMGE